MAGKVYDFPVLNQNPMKQGYVIAFCPDCEQENGRFYLPEDTEDLRVECLSCGAECRLIHISVDELQEVLKLSEEGMCKCLYDNEEINKSEGNPCEKCDGASHWEPIE